MDGGGDSGELESVVGPAGDVEERDEGELSDEEDDGWEECCDIVKKELEFMINKFVPFKSQTRTRKKHLSKEALKKIKNKMSFI